MDRDPTLPVTPPVASSAPAMDVTRGSGDPSLAPGVRDGLLGMTLGERYAIRELLGRGGMGAVYAATDQRLEREVAIKVVRADLSEDPNAVARFVREARAAAGLAHRGIVTVFDTGWNEGIPFIVMERLEGESLATRLRRGPIAQDAAVRIIDEVLAALEVAHRAGIVHRDVKPENVFLCRPDDQPKLLDFGVASVAKHASEGMRLTEAGAGIGTPLYVAPEQLKGEDATPRADVYAMGAVLYELLVGRPIFEARTLSELYVLKITDRPTPIASRAPAVPVAIAAVAERALERDPAKRFESCAAMRETLRLAAGWSSPTTTPTPTTTGASSAPAEPEPPPPPARELSASHRTPAPAQIEAAPSVVPARANYVARWALVGVVLGAVSVFAVIRRRSHGTASPVSHGRRAADAVRVTPVALREPAVGLRLLRDYHDASGSARALLTSPDRWVAAASDFARAIEQSGAPVRWRAARALCDGRASVLRGEIQAGIARIREALALEPEFALAHVALADALGLARDLPHAIEAAHRAEQIEPTWWVPVATVAALHSSGGHEDEAVPAFRRALQIAPDEPAILDGLALALHGARLDAEATTYADRALARDPDVVWAHVIRAERALESHDGAVALREATHATSVSPRVAAAQLARADALVLLHREPEARDVYQRTLELVDATHQQGLPSDRVDAVRAALAANRLPAPRGVVSVRSRRSAGSGGATATPGRTRATGGGGGGGGGGGDRSRTRAPDDFGNLGL